MKNNIIVIGNKCIFCRNCENKCPKSAISFIKNYQGFSYPKVNDKKCIDCSLCIKSCPVFEPTNISNNKQEDRYYYGNSKSIDVLYGSSSGGIFSEIINLLKAKYENIYICGAALNKKNNKFYLNHVCLKANNELSIIKKSKYIQSDLNNIFLTIQNLLNNGNYVLFCGTPCQAVALHKFLNKPYKNLLLIDFICHGVPSNKLLNCYLSSKFSKKEIEDLSVYDIDFRFKKDGWVNYDFKIGSISLPHNNNLFFKAFLSDISLRKSCDSGSFKGRNRCSDLTLGDFWTSNISLLNKISNYKLGVSCLITHTQVGDELIKELSDKVNLIESDETILQENRSYYQSPTYHSNYKFFYFSLNKYTFKIKFFIQKCLNKMNFLLRKVVIKRK